MLTFGESGVKNIQVGLSDIANKNTEHQVKFEFQINNMIFL